jgi:hypothetical protein
MLQILRKQSARSTEETLSVWAVSTDCGNERRYHRCRPIRGAMLICKQAERVRLDENDYNRKHLDS